MSILDRLLIQGVRSFGMKEEDAAEIKFKCPLTLILGNNGCGKTTIIESLKFATSGDQPPNSRAGQGGGSGFVHDPKMLNANEVLARVKLRIKDINGKKSTVTRAMKNVQKMKKVEFKKLDATISTENELTGKGDAISTRCVDVDWQMSYLLGVSKPILNYVIFCHQEESCWPLEEGKKVKERFDEIFGSVKYNACLENIRKLKKQRTQGITLLRKDADMLSVHKSEAEEKANKLREHENRLAILDQEILTCDQHISTLDCKLDTIKEKEINIANLIAEKKVNQIKLDELGKAIKEIRTSLKDKEFQGTDEQLEQEVDSFNTDLSEKKKRLNELEKELVDCAVAEKHLRSQLSDEQNDLGGLKRDEHANKELVQNRNFSINKLAADLKIQEMASPFSETQAACILENVESKLREMRRDVDALKIENENEEKKLQNAIDEVREERAKLEQIKKAKTEQLNQTKLDIENVKSEINEVAQSTKNLSILDNKLKRIDKDLEEHSNSINLNDIDKEIKELQRNRDRMEDELADVNKEMDCLIEVDRIQTTLDACLDRKVASEEEISRLKLKNEDAFKHLLGDVPQHNISKNLDLCINRLSDRIRSMQRDVNEKRQELTKLESKQHYLEEKLRVANNTLSTDMEHIHKLCGDDDYDRILADTANKLKLKQGECGKLSASNLLFREYVKKLQQPQPCCPLCKRQFEEELSAIQLAQELEGKLTNIPSMLSSVNEDQEMLSDKLNKLQQLKPVNERVATLKCSEIPAISKELAETKQKIEEIKEELIDMEHNLAGPQSDDHLARSVQSDAFTIDQKQSELEGLSREIEEHQSKIPPSGKSLQQVKDSRDQLQFELENTRKKIDANQTKKVNYNDRLNKLQNDRNDIIKQQLKVQTGKQKEQQLLDKEKQLKELKNTLMRDIDSAKDQVLPIQQRLDQAIRNKEEARKKNSASVESKTNLLIGLEQKCDEVHKMQNKIADFERRGIISKLAETEVNISRLKRDIDGLDQKRSLAQAKKDTVKADMSNQDARYRDLVDNKKLRLKRREEKLLEEKMNEMEEKLGVLDYRLIKEQLQSIQQEINLATGKKNHAEGKRNELASTISVVRSELERPHYRDAVKNYVEKIVDLEANESVNKDLDSYYIALDYALKHFHKQRMTEINRIVRELWRKIYRGNDIDHIEIKCDIETTTSAEKKRAYNYRVVQVKNDTELDMRGRCSAGQKMLASIIIRMALAETFSNNCRIMTLDEPTTNLDRDNIESLSLALAEIVNDQTKYKKFQLVIITHDEDFLMRLTSIDKVDHFWKVFKNEEGLSKVQLCPV